MAACSAKTYAGIVHDSAAASLPAQSLATQCPVIRAPRYTLQTGTEAWVLTDEQLAAKYAGKRVRITGIVSDGNKLKVISIALAK